MGNVVKGRATIREVKTLSDLKLVLRLEKETWGLASEDVTPITLAIALREAGSIFVGAFDREELVGFAVAFPSMESGKVGFHSHMLAVRPSHREHGLGEQLKLAQRQRALELTVKEMTWTFDPLRGPNAHLNFSKLGVICDSYRVDFYGPGTSSPLDANGTDRLWVTWRMTSARVEKRLKGNESRAKILEALRHIEPLVRFNKDGRPEQGDSERALSRQRVAIEIPGDMNRTERDEIDLARNWRLVTRQAFTVALKANFVVKEYCRSIRGEQGPGAYLMER